MRVLVAIDEDPVFEDVLASLRWCVRVGPEDEVTVLHATPVFAWMRLLAESEESWAECVREEDDKTDRLL